MYKSFEDMMNKISPTLRAIAHRMNGHFTYFSDDDLYQEALAHLWVRFRRGSLNDKTDSYILQGCYFHLKNYLRIRLDKAKVVSLNYPIDGAETPLEETLAGSDNYGREGIDEHLLTDNAILARLDAREKKVFRLSMEGMTLREIGKIMGTSHVMVLKIKSRIKDRCKSFRRITGDPRHN